MWEAKKRLLEVAAGGDKLMPAEESDRELANGRTGAPQYAPAKTRGVACFCARQARPEARSRDCAQIDCVSGVNGRQKEKNLPVSASRRFLADLGVTRATQSSSPTSSEKREKHCNQYVASGTLCCEYGEEGEFCETRVQKTGRIWTRVRGTTERRDAG
jgi:hypothetical protein